MYIWMAALCAVIMYGINLNKSWWRRFAQQPLLFLRPGSLASIINARIIFLERKKASASCTLLLASSHTRCLLAVILVFVVLFVEKPNKNEWENRARLAVEPATTYWSLQSLLKHTLVDGMVCNEGLLLVALFFAFLPSALPSLSLTEIEEERESERVYSAR